MTVLRVLVKRRLNNLHRVDRKESPLVLPVASAMSYTGAESFPGLHCWLTRWLLFCCWRLAPVESARVESNYLVNYDEKCGYFPNRFILDRKYRFLGGTLRPKFQFERSHPGANLGAESRVWQRAGGEAHSRRFAVDLPRCDRTGLAAESGRTFVGVQHHRGARRKMAEAQRFAAEHQRLSHRRCAENQPRSPGV